MMRLSWLRRLRPARALKRAAQALLVMLVVWAALWLILGVTIHSYGQVNRAESADVIIVLGAGLRPDGRPGPALTRRSSHAADLWFDGLAPRIICSGGMPGGGIRSEASACAEILRGRGVPAEAILLEESSRSTEENAIYSRAIMEANGWQTAVVVSDGYHVLRAGWIFHLRGLDISLSPVTDNRPRAMEYVLSIAREVAALHWQAFKEVFNLPVTYVKMI